MFVNTYFELFLNFFEAIETMPIGPHILQGVNAMIKTFLRFALLLMLCTLLAYAPEIFTHVSPPYSYAN